MQPAVKVRRRLTSFIRDLCNRYSNPVTQKDDRANVITERTDYNDRVIENLRENIHDKVEDPYLNVEDSVYEDDGSSTSSTFSNDDIKVKKIQWKDVNVIKYPRRNIILGKGSFGTVIRAQLKDGNHSHDVAIKIQLHAYDNKETQQHKHDKTSLRARREAYMMMLAQSKVQSDLVTNVYGIIEGPLPKAISQILHRLEDEYAVGIVMQYEALGSLDKYINGDENNIKPVLPMYEKVRLLTSIAQGLQDIHSVGIVHADIKPANILLSDDDPPQIKLCDFGMSIIQNEIIETKNDPSSGSRSDDKNDRCISNKVKLDMNPKSNTNNTKRNSDSADEKEVILIPNNHSPFDSTSRHSNHYHDDDVAAGVVEEEDDDEDTNRSQMEFTKRNHGTRIYCAPELLVNPYQLNNLSSNPLSDSKTTSLLSMVSRPSRKSDMYAFAIVAWQVLSQKRPFRDITSEAMLCSRVHMGHRPDLSEIPLDTPENVKNMIRLCWSKNRKKRLTATECYDILVAELDDLYKYECSVIEVDHYVHESTDGIMNTISNDATITTAATSTQMSQNPAVSATTINTYNSNIGNKHTHDQEAISALGYYQSLPSLIPFYSKGKELDSKRLPQHVNVLATGSSSYRAINDLDDNDYFNDIDLYPSIDFQAFDSDYSYLLKQQSDESYIATSSYLPLSPHSNKHKLNPIKSSSLYNSSAAGLHHRTGSVQLQQSSTSPSSMKRLDTTSSHKHPRTHSTTSSSSPIDEEPMSTRSKQQVSNKSIVMTDSRQTNIMPTFLTTSNISSPKSSPRDGPPLSSRSQSQKDQILLLSTKDKEDFFASLSSSEKINKLVAFYENLSHHGNNHHATTGTTTIRRLSEEEKKDKEKDKKWTVRKDYLLQSYSQKSSQIIQTNSTNSLFKRNSLSTVVSTDVSNSLSA